MYIKHVKPMKRAHNKSAAYTAGKSLSAKSIDIAALLLVLLILLLAGAQFFDSVLF